MQPAQKYLQKQTQIFQATKRPQINQLLREANLKGNQRLTNIDLRDILLDHYWDQYQAEKRVAEEIRRREEQAELEEARRKYERRLVKLSDIDKPFTLTETAHKGYTKTYQISPSIRDTKPIRYLYNNAGKIVNLLTSDLAKFKGIKFSVKLSTIFEKMNGPDEVVRDLMIGNSKTIPLLSADMAPAAIEEAFSQVNHQLDNETNKGSGWKFDHIVDLTVITSAYKPMAGRSYIKLPAKLASKKAIINVKNNDNRCHMWAVLSAIHLAPDHVDRVANYQRFANELNYTGLVFPITVNDQKKFEDLNPTISVNLFGYDSDDSKVYPLYISNCQGRPHQIDLLLLSENGNKHYCWIKDLNKLMADYNKNGNRKWFCKRCLHAFSREDLLIKHKDRCAEFGIQRTELPAVGKNTLKFTNYQKGLPSPFVIYCDFESILVKLDDGLGLNRMENIIIGKETNGDQPATTKTQEHIPCGFHIYTVCFDDPTKNSQPIIYRGPDCMNRFYQALTNENNRIQQILSNPAPMIYGLADERKFRNRKRCHICSQKFKANSTKGKTLFTKVRDHCHITGKFRGPAHEACNLNYKFCQSLNRKVKVPVIIHNLRGYDSHLIIKHFHDRSANISCIPNNMEKYMALAINNLQFIDSFQFMSDSLETLVGNLKRGGIAEFKITSKFYRGEQLELMTQKGIYPYSYMDSWERFNETELPPKSAFYNDLSEEKISDKDYQTAQKIWTTFGCQTLGDYHDIYLKSDVLLLADVFESFRRTSLRYYGLDPANYFTAPGMAWDALLKLTGVQLELLTDIDMYQFVESAVRGGICMITKRFAQANNPYMTDYDKDKPTSYIQYLDANNLYGWAMSYQMPTHGFQWVDPEQFDEHSIMAIADDSPLGYFLEVDIDYPAELHMEHNDYPLLPEKKIVTSDMLSRCQREIKERHNLADDKVQKLIPNLSNKRNYIIHHRYLQTAIRLGLKLVKVHKVLQFRQRQ